MPVTSASDSIMGWTARQKKMLGWSFDQPKSTRASRQKKAEIQQLLAFIIYLNSKVSHATTMLELAVQQFK